jgi:hypothetical protein
LSVDKKDCLYLGDIISFSINDTDIIHWIYNGTHWTITMNGSIYLLKAFNKCIYYKSWAEMIMWEWEELYYTFKENKDLWDYQFMFYVKK